MVEDVKDKCVGYTVGKKENFIQLINKSKSINELLHVFHSYIMNNEKNNNNEIIKYEKNIFRNILEKIKRILLKKK